MSLSAQAHERRRLLSIEGLENRIALTTNISFANNVLTITLGADNEVATLSTSGTNLNIKSSDIGGTTADAAAQVLGFANNTVALALNTGSIAAASDVRQIVINGAGQNDGVEISGGTFPALTIDNSISTVAFDVADSSFAKISPLAANADLTVDAGSFIALDQNLTTQDGGKISLAAPTGVTLGVGATLNTTGGATLTGGDINLSAVAGLGHGLSLNAGTGGLITVSGDVDDVSLLTVTNSGGANFQGALDQTTAGDVTLAGSTGTVAFTGSANINTLTTANQAYGISFTGTSTTVKNPITFLNAGTVTLTNAAGQTATFSGGMTINGAAVVAGQGTVNTGDLNLLSGGLIGSTGLLSSGNVTLAGGAMVAPTGTFDVAGNFARTAGAFTAAGGTVALTGTNQTITGSTTFNNLSKTAASTGTLTFSAGDTTTVTGALTLQGADATNLLALRSSAAGTAWLIDPQGTSSVKFVDAQDSDNLEVGVKTITANNSTSSGNNTNWVFPDLTYNAPANSSLSIGVNGANVELKNGATLIQSQPLAATNSISINGSTGESLTITNGAVPVSVPTINFNNTTATNNQLVVDGGTFTNAAFDYASAHDGSVKLDASTINYTNLTPILVPTIAATNVTFTLPASVGGTNAVLADVGGALLLHSNNGTFEDTTFADPLGTLTILPGNAADTLDFTATLNLLSSLSVGTAASPLSAVTIGNPLALGVVGASLAVHAATINENAGTITTSGSQEYDGAVVLSATPTTFQSTTGAAITFDGSVTGAATDLVVTSSGTTTFGGNVSVHSLDATSAGGITAFGAAAANVNATTTQNYNGAVSLSAAATAFTSSGNQAIGFVGTVTGGGTDLTVTSDGTTSFGGNVSVKSLTASSAVGTAAFAATVSTVASADSQAYNGAVTLGAGTTTFSSSNNQALSFGNSLTGAANDLTVASGGTTTFGGNVDVKSLMASNPAGTTAFGAAVTLVTSVNTQTYDDDVMLATGATAFVSSGNQALTFNKAVTGASNDLTVTSGGTTTLGGNVNVKSLTASSIAGTTAFGPAVTLVTSANTQTYSDAVTLGAGATTFASSNNQALNFNNTITGAGNDLTISSDGTITLGGNVNVKSLTASSAAGTTAFGPAVSTVTSVDAQTYQGGVTLSAGATAFASSGNQALNFNKAVTGAGTDFTISSGGTTTLGGNVNVKSLTASSNAGTTAFGPAVTLVTSVNTQTYNDGLTLATGSTAFVSSGNQMLSFNKTVAGVGNDFSVSTDGTTTFGGNVNVKSLTASSVAGTTAFTAAVSSVTSANNQTYNGPVTLGVGATTFASTANQALSFKSTVNGPGNDFSVTSDGTSSFGGDVNVKSMTATSTAGTTAFGTAVAQVASANSQTFNDAVTLGAGGTTFVSSNNQTLSFNKGVTGAGNDFAVKSDGTTNFGGNVSVKSLIASSTAGTTAFGGAVSLVTSVNSQTYNDLVTLGTGGTAFVSSGNQAITFNKAVTGAGNDFAFSSDGTTSFGGNVNVKSVTATSTSGTTAFGSGVTQVTSANVQTYNDAVTLSAAATSFKSNNDQNLSFGKTVTGAGNDLTVASGGMTTFGGDVIANSLTASSTAGTTKAQGDITTQVDQTYQGQFVLANPAGTPALPVTQQLTTNNNGNVMFAQTLNAAAAGAQGLRLSVGAGNMTFTQDVGGTPLASLIADGTTGMTTAMGNISTTGEQAYFEQFMLANPTATAASPVAQLLTTAGGDVTFSQALNAATAAAQGLVVSVDSGNVMFGADVGTSPLASLVVNGNTGTITAKGNVTTQGQQTYNEQVLLANPTGTSVIPVTQNLTSNGNSDVTFAQAVSAASPGAQGLLVSVGTGNITFGGNVGGIALASLTAAGTTGITKAMGNVATTGAQTYQQQFLLANPAASAALPIAQQLATAGGDVTFAQTVNAAAAGAQGLAISVGQGNVTFHADVGATALANLAVSGTTGTTKALGNFSTRGTQSFGEALLLANPAASSATPVTQQFNTADGDVTFAQTVNAATAGAQALLVSTGAGNITFGGDVGGTPLASLKADGTTGTTTAKGNITTVGTQTFVQQFMLGDPSATAAAPIAQQLFTNNSDVTFAQTVNAIADGAQGLKLSVGTGIVNFQDSVGTQANHALGSVTVDSGPFTFSHGMHTARQIAVNAGNSGAAAGNILLNAGANLLSSAPDKTNGGIALNSSGDIKLNTGASPIGVTLTAGGASTLGGTAMAINLHAAHNVLIDKHATLTAMASANAPVVIQTDNGGSTLDLRGTILATDVNVVAPDATDTINVQNTASNLAIQQATLAASAATTNVVTAGTINLSSFAGEAAAGGTLAPFQSLLIVNGPSNHAMIQAALGHINTGGAVLNLDNSGDNSNTAGALTANSLLGMGMMGASANQATAVGIQYGLLAQLNLSLGSAPQLDFHAQSTAATTPVNLYGQGMGTVDVGDFTPNAANNHSAPNASGLDGVLSLLNVSDVQKLSLNDQSSANAAGSGAQNYYIGNLAVARGIQPMHALSLAELKAATTVAQQPLIQYTHQGAGTVQINGTNVTNDHFNLFLPNGGQFNDTLNVLALVGGTQGANQAMVVAPQSSGPANTAATAGPSFVNTVRVGDLGSAYPMQLAQVQGLYMYGSPTQGNDYENHTSNARAVPSVLVGGNNNDTLIGGPGADVLFGGSGGGNLFAGGVANPLGTQQDFVFAGFLPTYDPTTNLVNGIVSTNTTQAANTAATGANQAGAAGVPNIDGGHGTVVSNIPGTSVTDVRVLVGQGAILKSPVDWLKAITFAFSEAEAQSIFQQILGDAPVIHGLQTAPKQPPASQLPTADTLLQTQNFVAAAYKQTFGHAPDDHSLNYWTDLLFGVAPQSSAQTTSSTATANQQAATAAISRLDFANALTHSAEYYQGQVIAPAYLQYLGRAADDAGLAYWTAQMQHGLTDEQLEAGFIASDEFFNVQGGGTNAGYVDALYEALLNRQADPGGQAYWLGQLNAGAPRSQVAFGFANSFENERSLIEGDYQKYLGRQPDPQGVDYWVTQFTNGMSNESLIAGFIGSQEYFNVHNQSVYQGGYTFNGASGTAILSVDQLSDTQIMGEITLQDATGKTIGTGSFVGQPSTATTSDGTQVSKNRYSGNIAGLTGGPTRFTMTLNGQITGTLSGLNGASGSFGPLSSSVT